MGSAHTCTSQTRRTDASVFVNVFIDQVGHETNVGEAHQDPRDTKRRITLNQRKFK